MWARNQDQTYLLSFHTHRGLLKLLYSVVEKPDLIVLFRVHLVMKISALSSPFAPHFTNGRILHFSVSKITRDTAFRNQYLAKTYSTSVQPRADIYRDTGPPPTPTQATIFGLPLFQVVPSIAFANSCARNPQRGILHLG
jgi:hypothetical protein